MLGPTASKPNFLYKEPFESRDEDCFDSLRRLDDRAESREERRCPLLLMSRSDGEQCILDLAKNYLLLDVPSQLFGKRYPHPEQTPVLFGFALD